MVNEPINPNELVFAENNLYNPSSWLVYFRTSHVATIEVTAVRNLNGKLVRPRIAVAFGPANEREYHGCPTVEDAKVWVREHATAVVHNLPIQRSKVRET